MPPPNNDEDFGLSSSDEADLLKLAIPPSLPRKRKSEDPLNADSKRSRREEQSPALSPAASLARRVLQSRFGMDAFRLKQEEAIARLLEGHSAVVVSFLLVVARACATKCLHSASKSWTNKLDLDRDVQKVASLWLSVR